jgi:hypothetical protein
LSFVLSILPTPKHRVFSTGFTGLTRLSFPHYSGYLVRSRLVFSPPGGALPAKEDVIPGLLRRFLDFSPALSILLIPSTSHSRVFSTGFAGSTRLSFVLSILPTPKHRMFSTGLTRLSFVLSIVSTTTGTSSAVDWSLPLRGRRSAGAGAVVKRRWSSTIGMGRQRLSGIQRVCYLQDSVIAYQDQAWGAGEILLNHRCTPGTPVDRYRSGYKTYILISRRGEGQGRRG